MSTRTMGRAAMLAAVTLATASAVAMTGPAAHAAPEDALAGKKYVALGDSFAAGIGLGPYSSTPAPGCLQSTAGVAATVASRFGLELTDVSCSGATIANVASTPQAVPGATVPAQLDAVTADTALVSLMIGGNDAGFSTLLSGCAAATPNGPLLLDPTAASCAAKYGGALGAGLQAAVAPALDVLLAAIRQKAPDAAIVLLGYPALAPTDASTPVAGCFNPAVGTGQPPFPADSFPFTTADRSYIAGLSAQLDLLQRSATAAHGAVFVSNLASTDAHTPCAGTAEPWLNGVTVASLTPPAVVPASMHPNAAGAAHLADQLAAAFAQTVPEPPAEGGTLPAVDSTESTDSTAPAATGPTAELANTGADGHPVVLAALGALTALGAGGWFSARRRRTVRATP